MPLILKIVGLDFFGQSDAPALLRQIDQHARAFLADHLQGHLQLVAAIATQRGDQIAGETGRMQTNQRLGGFGRIADYNRHRLLVFVLNAIAQDPAGTESGRQIRFGHAENQFFAAPAIADQGLDADDLQLKFFGQFEKFFPGSPVAGFAENFDQHAGWFQIRPCAPDRRRPRYGRPVAARRLLWPPADTDARAA